MRSRQVNIILVGVFTSAILADVGSAYYSPRLGRFLSRDPISEQGTSVSQPQRQPTSFIPRDQLATGEETNAYVFVLNSPVQLVDPIGLQPSQGTVCCTYRTGNRTNQRSVPNGSNFSDPHAACRCWLDATARQIPFAPRATIIRAEWGFCPRCTVKALKTVPGILVHWGLEINCPAANGRPAFVFTGDKWPHHPNSILAVVDTADIRFNPGVAFGTLVTSHKVAAWSGQKGYDLLHQTYPDSADHRAPWSTEYYQFPFHACDEWVSRWRDLILQYDATGWPD